MVKLSVFGRQVMEGLAPFYFNDYYWSFCKDYAYKYWTRKAISKFRGKAEVAQSRKSQILPERRKR